MTVDLNRLGGFPARAYHPVFGERAVKDANAAHALGHDWFNTPAEADAARTQTEAELARHHNLNVKTAAATAEGAPGVVRNSVQADLRAKQGNPEPL